MAVVQVETLLSMITAAMEPTDLEEVVAPVADLCIPMDTRVVQERPQRLLVLGEAAAHLPQVSMELPPWAEMAEPVWRIPSQERAQPTAEAEAAAFVAGPRERVARAEEAQAGLVPRQGPQGLRTPEAAVAARTPEQVPQAVPA